jgi:omega-hydroxy-beta-dihydromenaquinone-9 sulfotransferase
MGMVHVPPLAGCSLRVFLQLLIENRGVDPQYLPRALSTLGLCALGGLVRPVERIWFEQKVKPLNIDHAPIFVIGHWRSGTTLLHTLMSQDERFGYISNYQACLPEQSLGTWPISRKIMAKNLPSTRPMDNMTMVLDSPQEEEYALSNLGLYGFYQGWSFPRRIQKYFEEKVLFEGVSPGFREQWKAAYMKVIRLANYNSQGKPLVLKNPANTARIKVLLELFPDAKFIHIYRHPLTVYVSTQNLYRKLLPIHTFQSFDIQEIDAHILGFYKQLMQRFLDDRHLIPEGNLIEVRFEDMEKNPLEEVAKIYRQFGLNFAATEVKMRNYLATQQGYRKNRYAIDPGVQTLVAQHCRFAFDHWEYPLHDETSTEISHSVA